MTSHDREILLRVKTDVQGAPQVEQLTSSLSGLSQGAAATGASAASGASGLRDLETRATAANRSMEVTRRVFESVNDALSITTDGFESLKLEYQEGRIGLAEYLKELGELRTGLDDVESGDARLARAKRALNSETTRLTQSNNLAKLGFEGTATQAGNANTVLFQSQNVIRGLNGDFPALAQSIGPALRSFNQLQLSSGGVGGAMRAMLGVMGGPMGLVFALGSLLPSAIITASALMARFREDAELSKEEVAELTKGVIELIEANARLISSPSAFGIERLRLETAELERIVKQRKELADTEETLFYLRFRPGSEAQQVEALGKIKELEATLGTYADIELKALESQLETRRQRLALFEAELSADTLAGLEARNKAALEAAQNESVAELSVRRDANLAERKLIAEKLKAAQGDERADLLARLRMHEDFGTKLAEIYASRPKPVDPGLLDFERAAPSAQADPLAELLKNLPGATNSAAGSGGTDERGMRAAAMMADWMQQTSGMELDMLRQTGREKEALEREHATQIARIRREALMAGLADTDEFLALEQAMREQHTTDLAQIALEEAQTRIQFAADVASALNGFGTLIYGNGEKNARKAFEFNRQAATSEALINTYLAATKAAGQTGIGAFVAAPAVTLLGLLQVAKIQATQFKGGSSGATSGGSTSFRGMDLAKDIASTTNQQRKAEQERANRPQPPIVVHPQPESGTREIRITDGFGNIVARGQEDLDRRGGDSYVRKRERV